MGRSRITLAEIQCSIEDEERRERIVKDETAECLTGPLHFRRAQRWKRVMCAASTSVSKLLLSVNFIWDLKP